ncbi:MAG: hypothetical protein ACE5J9_07570, partial [Methanosarcinales archaeon]
QWSKEIALATGINTITIVARDNHNNTKTKTINVFYEQLNHNNTEVFSQYTKNKNANISQTLSESKSTAKANVNRSNENQTKAETNFLGFNIAIIILLAVYICMKMYCSRK